MGFKACASGPLALKEALGTTDVYYKPLLMQTQIRQNGLTASSPLCYRNLTKDSSL